MNKSQNIEERPGLIQSILIFVILPFAVNSFMSIFDPIYGIIPSNLDMSKFKEVIESISHALPILLIIQGVLVLLYTWPVFRFVTGNQKESLADLVRQRSLNMPFVIGIISMLGWVIPTPLVIFGYYELFSAVSIKMFMPFIVSMMFNGFLGLILTFYSMEFFLRKYFIRKIFSDKKISDCKNTVFLSIRARFFINYFAVSIFPIFLILKLMYVAEFMLDEEYFWTVFIVVIFSIAVLGIFMTFLISSSFRKPLMAMKSAVERIGGGEYDQKVDVVSADEMGKLGEGVNQMGEDLQRMMSTVQLKNQELSTAYEKLEEYSDTLEQKVKIRTAELNKSLEDVEEANKKVMDSIEYAKMIQRSLLPNRDEISRHLPDSFILWNPRDVVGGDLYFTEFFKNEFIVCVVDCTGHGVPGALMTMIAASGLRKIIRDEQIHQPAKVLKKLNFFIKTSLQQDTKFALSNDGLDASICLVKPKEKILEFAGARLPLVYLNKNESIRIRGDRVSIGYKNSKLRWRK